MKAPAVIALSRFPAGVMVWEAAPGQETLTVIAKATFTLAPGELQLAPQQDPLVEETHADLAIASGLPAHGFAAGSLRYPGDFAPSKRRVDVSLVGHAFAAHGVPTSSLLARLAIAELDKTVRVTGDRSWESAPAAFTRMPICYERAPRTGDNPVGVASSHVAANLSLSGGATEEDQGAAPCFGPIASTWPSRRRLCEEAATFWAHGVARDRRLGGPPPGPAPPRFDFSFFNAAPVDQQLDLLRPGAPLELENLHPRHPRLVATLPKLRPQVFALPDASSGRVEEVILRCDAVFIDTDRAVLVLTWRGLMELKIGAGIRSVVVIADDAGKKLRFAQVEKWLGDEVNPTLRLGGEEAEVEDYVTLTDPLAERHDARKAQVLVTDMIEDEPTFDQGAHVGGDPQTPAAGARVGGDPQTPAAGARVGAEPKGAPAAPPRTAPQKTIPLQFVQPVVQSTAEAGPQAPAASRPTLVLRADLTLDRCAEIAAALAEPGANRASVLRARMLTEASWSIAEKHWHRVIAAEAERGERTAADAFDEAVVRAQEHRASPIDLVAYAHLSVAVERGAVGQILDDLALGLPDLVRLHRVWERRVAASPELAARLAHALDEARRT